MIGRIVVLILVACWGLSAKAAPDAGAPSVDVAPQPGAAAGVPAPAASLPVDVDHPPGARAVDSAKAFLDARFEAAMRAEAALESYFRALQDRSRPLDKGWVAAIAGSGRLERDAPTAQGLRRFLESAGGTTLSPTDRQVLGRYEAELAERLESRRKQAEAWSNMFTLPAGATPRDVRKWAVNFAPAIDWLRQLDDETFERVLVRMAEEIEDPIDVARWKRLLATAFDARQRVRSHEPRTAMRRLAAAGTAIDDVLKGRPDFSGLRPDEQAAVRELLTDALVNAPGRPASMIIQVARLDDVMTPEQVRFLPDKILALASAMWSSLPE
ncbi:hypothetical protein [Phreatobacter stygius]|uniref:DUF2059 domain-containing protein n=1 Tax=Phreatobacter stygius TaxID=1940610 RepID=A0A4D7B827_9HYPH|nr:hypothetical protein [Phreatobacter stygius]QCI66570.1 hypothetical protein E8M01_21465 [Phreatobacter stygius]